MSKLKKTFFKNYVSEKRFPLDRMFDEHKGATTQGMIRIEKNYENEFEAAQNILGAILMLSGVRLPDRELQLLTFLSIKGTISDVKNRQEFVEKYNTTLNTMANMLTSLKKKGLVKKVGGKHQPTITLPEDIRTSGSKQLKCGLLCRAN